ncbi:hypothetical protein LXL04_013327 [Taraxacum kok-saghyz]
MDATKSRYEEIVKEVSSYLKKVGDKIRFIRPLVYFWLVFYTCYFSQRSINPPPKAPQQTQIRVFNGRQYIPQDGDPDVNSFINPATPSFNRHTSGSSDVLGGSVYDTVYYSSLFSDNQDDGFLQYKDVGLKNVTKSLGIHEKRYIQHDKQVMMLIQQVYARSIKTTTKSESVKISVERSYHEEEDENDPESINGQKVSSSCRVRRC